MSKKKKFLLSLLVFPPAYLAVLLTLDLRYYDASEMAYTIPLYPYPTYLKVVLSILSCISFMIVGAMTWDVSEPKKENQAGSNALIQENEMKSVSKG
ncbi:hypothetical protein [Gimesia sp.]|uniref:hypothetical protein n=1 Tax=Gimesia sp. TaxID=2024833 RepID=UPI003A949C4F